MLEMQKAVTATTRKIAVLFYNAMSKGINYQDSGADLYEQPYQERVIKSFYRRAADLGYTLPEVPCVS